MNAIVPQAGETPDPVCSSAVRRGDLSAALRDMLFHLPESALARDLRQARTSLAGRRLASLMAASDTEGGIAGAMAALALACTLRANAPAVRDWIAEATGWQPVGDVAADGSARKGALYHGLFLGAVWADQVTETAARLRAFAVEDTEFEEGVAMPGWAMTSDQIDRFEVAGARDGIAAVTLPILTYCDDLAGLRPARLIDILALDPGDATRFWCYSGLVDAAPQPLDWLIDAEWGGIPRVLRLFRYPLDLLRDAAGVDSAADSAAEPGLKGRVCVLDWSSIGARSLLAAVDSGRCHLVCDDDHHARVIRALVRPKKPKLQISVVDR